MFQFLLCKEERSAEHQKETDGKQNKEITLKKKKKKDKHGSEDHSSANTSVCHLHTPGSAPIHHSQPEMTN